MFIEKLKVKNRLLLLVVMGVSGFIILAFFALGAINRVRVGSRFYTELKNHYAALEKIELLQNYLSKIRVLSLSMFLVTGHDEHERLCEEINKTQGLINEEFRDMAAILDEQDILIALGSAHVTLDKFFETMEKESCPAIFSGDKAKAWGIVTGKEQLMQTWFSEQVDSAANAMRLYTDDYEKTSVANVRMIIGLFVVASIILALLSAFFALSITVSITKPLKAVTDACNLVAAGDLAKRLEITSLDEIGQLAASFNKMTENLQKATVSKNYVDSIIRGIVDALIVVDPSGNITMVNRPALDMLGYREDEVIGMPFADIFSAKEIKEVLDEFEENVSLISKDFRIIEINNAFLKASGLERKDIIGQHCYKITHHRNDICMPPHDKCPILEVNERNKPCAELHAHLNKEGSRFLVNVVAAPIRDKRSDIYYLHIASPAHKQQIALPEDSEIVKSLVRKLEVYLDTIEKEKIFRENDLDELSKVSAVANLEMYYRAKSGEKILVNLSASVMKDALDNSLGIIFVARDIREVKRLIQKEKEMTATATMLAVERAKAGELEQLYNNLKERDGELKQDYDFQKAVNLLFNLSLKDISIEELLKYTIGLPWFGFEPRGSIFLVDDDNPKVLVMKAESNLSEEIKRLCAQIPFGKCLCGRSALTHEIEFAEGMDERHEITYPGIHPHGHYCVPIMFAGKLIGIMNMYTVAGHKSNQKEEEGLRIVANVLAGIIIRKRAEDSLKKAYSELTDTHAQLIQSEKMAAIGLLASGVAHEIKNPLAIIIQGSEYLKSVLPAESSALDSLSKIINAGLRADKIIKALLNFSRQTAAVFEETDLSVLIEDSLMLVEHQLSLRNVKIIRQFAPGLPKVKVDANQMKQVLINILVNASDAMRDGGAITIDLEEVRLSPQERYLQMTFTDTGCGIPEEHIAKVLDPFFTTKGKEGGSGLGLSISKGIIETHKGKIEIKSKVGQGTSVIIRLPV